MFNDTLYQNVTTVVTHEIGSGSWLLCLVLFLFTGKIINRFTHNSEKSLDISVSSTKRVKNKARSLDLNIPLVDNCDCFLHPPYILKNVSLYKLHNDYVWVHPYVAKKRFINFYSAGKYEYVFKI